MRVLALLVISVLLSLEVLAITEAASGISRAGYVQNVISARYALAEVAACDVSFLPFPDVELSSDVTPFLCIAYRDGIIHGYPDGFFRPDQIISLEEAAKVTALSRNLHITEGETWYDGYVTALENVGLLQEETATVHDEVTSVALLLQQTTQYLDSESETSALSSSLSSQSSESSEEEVQTSSQSSSLSEQSSLSSASSVSSTSSQQSSSAESVQVSTDDTKRAQSLFDQLSDEIRILPPALTQDMRSILGDPPQKQGGVRHYSKDNVHFFIWQRGDTVDRFVVLIQGEVTPASVAGLWERLQGSTLEHVILSWVPVGGDAKDIPADSLPQPLAQTVTAHYGGTIDFAAGTHLLGKLRLRGSLEKVLSGLNFPTTSLQLLAGQALPELGVSTAASGVAEASKKDSSFTEALKPTHFIEITRRGVWERPLDLQSTTLTDATVYLDEGPAFGFWGKGTFDTEKIVLFYKGPLKFSKDPTDYLEAQLGFGAETMSLTQYLKFISVYNTRFPGAKYSFAGSADNARDATLDATFASLNALPLDLLKVTNSQIANVDLSPGSKFPGREVFNLMILGPLAEGKDGTKGPLIHLDGDAALFNERFGSLALDIDTSGARGSSNGTLGIPLGSVAGYDLGTLGGSMSLDLSAGPTVQSMRLEGTVNVGPLDGRSLAIDLHSDHLSFSSAASCSFPFAVRASLPITATTDLSLNSIQFNPEALMPDPTALLNCPEDIFVLLKNGVVYAFNGSVQLASFALDQLPDNAATQIGKDGLKFANGAVSAGGEALLNAAASVPGVEELNEFGQQGLDEAKKKAEEAARELAKAAEEARKAAEEARKAAERAAKEAARQAEKAINEGIQQFNSFVSNPAGTLESIGSVFEGAASTVSGWFGGGGSSLAGFGWRGPYVPIKAIDVGGSHKLNPQTGRLMAWFVGENGYPLELEDRNHWNLHFWYRQNGLPGNFPGFVRIDADDNGYAAAIDKKGRLWTYNGTWRVTDTYATDVGIGGGKIWITSTEPLWNGYKIYRAPYASGRTSFNWKFMDGAGTRIDVGSDGRAWALNNKYEVWEWNNGWHNRHGQAIDLTVSAGNRVWVLSAADYNTGHGGGRIFTFNRAGCTWVLGHCHPYSDNWEATQGFAHTIGSGFGVFVWAVNSHNNIYGGTGRP